MCEDIVDYLSDNVDEAKFGIISTRPTSQLLNNEITNAHNVPQTSLVSSSG
jgi:hypothetical protein